MIGSRIGIRGDTRSNSSCRLIPMQRSAHALPGALVRAAARRAALGRQGDASPGRPPSARRSSASPPSSSSATCCSSKPPARSGRAKSCARRRVILPRLQTLLGADTVERIEVCEPSEPEVRSMRESVIVSAVRTPTGKFLGALKGFTATAARRARRRRSRPPRRHRSRRSSTSASWATSSSAGLGQNPARQAALNGGLPDHVAALTINKVCGSGLKAVMLADQGDPRRRHRHRRRRRHGVDEQLPVPAAARARRPAHGQRRGRRLDDQRRPVVRVRAVPHGQLRRGRRRALQRRPRRAGRVRRAQPSEGRARHRARARSRTRSCRSRFRRRRATPLVVDRDEAIRADTTAEALARAEAGVQEGRHGDRRQRAGRQRRRVGARRDGRRARARRSASRRSRASSRRRPAAWRRSSC